MNLRLKNTLRRSVAFLICAAFTATAAIGQSLSISKKPDSTYSVQSSVPGNAGYALQETENFQRWYDVREELHGPFTYPVATNWLVPQRYFRIKPAVPPADPIRLMIIGDSMASDCCGWGQGIPRFVKENVTVINYAFAWYSTKIFLQSAEWENMHLIQPNYVLIQYGWMEGSPDPDRGTSGPEFAANLRTIIEAVRGFNGVPILITLHANRIFDSNGKIVPFPQPHSEVLKQVAIEMNTPMIDLYKLSTDLFNTLGPAGVEFMMFNQNDPSDKMHFSPAGGTWVAQLVAKALPDSLTPYLTRMLEPVPKP